MPSTRILTIALLLAIGDLRSQEPRLVCAACHPTETRNYLASAMGRSIGPPDPVPAGKINEPQSGSLIQAEWRRGRLYHRLSEDGMTAEYAILYQIGAGKVGHSYAVLAKDFLLESPASYYRRYGWDISPGYAGSELIDFNRVLTPRCLFCHSNSPNFFQARNHAGNDLSSISCERCHGDTAEHVKHPSGDNVVNPENLPARARDSVCEQCHLEGLARVLNPGKLLTDFMPGMSLEDVLVIYVSQQTTPGVKAVSQEEQLAASRCARESHGRLWCGTCHNPHTQPKNRDAEIKSICKSCHLNLSASGHADTPECVSCHMPQRSAADVAHAALTDHRILARPDATAPARVGGLQAIEAWHDPQRGLEERDLGLADLAASATTGFQHLAEAGENLLKGLPASQQNGDPAVIAALGNTALSHGHAAEAVQLFRRARELEPASGEYALYLGIALKQNKHFGTARDELEQAIQLDHSLQRAYLELSAIDVKQGRISEANSVLGQYLAFDPESILVRLTKQTLTTGRK